MCVKKNNKKEIDLGIALAIYSIIVFIVGGIFALYCCNC